MLKANPFYLIFCIAFFLWSSFSSGQIILLDPVREGGFEMGPTLADNGWQSLDTSDNQWYVGPLTSCGGQNGAYISADGGLSNIYNTTQVTSSLLYRSVNFPDSGDFTLLFDYRGRGSFYGDGFSLYIIPDTISFTCWNLDEIYKLGAWGYYENSNWSSFRFNLGTSYNGQSCKLVFRWLNFTNTVSANQPPSAIDNVMIASLPPIAGNYTIDPSQTTSGTNFNGINEAIAYVNLAGVDSGGVYFNIPAGSVFQNKLIPLTVQADSSSQVVFRKTGIGLNPRVVASGTKENRDAIISIRNANYITFNGIDAIQGLGDPIEFGYYITQKPGADGGHHNTIKNANIALLRTNLNSIGVFQEFSYPVIGSVPGNPNSFNKYLNLYITNCAKGIFLDGNYATSCEIGGENGGKTYIGGELPGDISLSGIHINSLSDLRIYDSEIRNISGKKPEAGIKLSYLEGNCLLERCSIHNIVNTDTSAGEAVGIKIQYGADAVNLTARNIEIFGLRNAVCKTPVANNVIGIYIFENALSNIRTGNFQHISILIDSAELNSSACIEVYNGSSSNTQLTFENNVLANTTSSQSGNYKHYCYYFNKFTTQTQLNYNDLFLSNPVNGYISTSLGIQYPSLQTWQTYCGKEQNSISANPNFIQGMGVRLPPGISSPLESAGNLTSSLPIDIEGDARPGPQPSMFGGALSPDIGADEFDGVPTQLWGPTIMYQPISARVVSTLIELPKFAEITGLNGVELDSGQKPRLYFKRKQDSNIFIGNSPLQNGWKYVESVDTVSPFGFVIDFSLFNSSPLAGDTIDYFIVAMDTLIPAHVSLYPAIPSVLQTNVQLNSGAFPVSSFSSFKLIPPLSGIYTVGREADFESLSSNNGLFDVLNQNPVSGHITAKIISDLDENGIHSLHKLNTGSNAYELRIIPDTSKLRKIEGYSNFSLIRFMGTQRITIDGNFNGEGQYLAFTNTANAGNTATLHFYSPDSSNVVAYDTLRNCRISSNNNGYAVCAGAEPGIAGNRIHNVYIGHNHIVQAQTGIYGAVNSSVFSHDLFIEGNYLGSANDKEILLGTGIEVSGFNSVTINRNIIEGIRKSTTGHTYGILLGTGLSNLTISNNQIHGISHVSGGTSGAYGIYFNSSATIAGGTLFNNVIYDLSSKNHSTGFISPAGIMANSGINITFYYNSILINGEQTGNSGYTTACLALQGTSHGWMLRNNLFANTLNGLKTGAKNYTVYFSHVNYHQTDYNDYFVSGMPKILAFVGADKADLTLLRLATGGDIHSFSKDPVFNSQKNLVPYLNSPVFGTGIPVSNIQTDLNGEPRSTVQPSTGAFETGADIRPPVLTFSPLPTAIVLPSLPLSDYFEFTDTSGIDTLSVNKPRLYYKKRSNQNIFADNSPSTDGWKFAEATSSGQKYSFNIEFSRLGPTQNGSLAGIITPSDTVDYFLLVSDASPHHNLAISSGTMAKPPNGTHLDPEHFPVTGAAFFRVLDSVSGIIRVGTGGDFPNLSGSNGLFSFLKYKVLTADLQVKIISNLSEPSTYNPLEQVDSWGGLFYIRFIPDTSIERTISGNCQGGLLKLRGSDRIIIDGSYMGQGRYLKIFHTGYSASAGGIELISQGSGKGCTNITIRNCNISTNSVLNDYSFGIKAGQASVIHGGENNDSLLIENNTISKAFKGILYFGSADFPGTHVKIQNNQLGHIDSQNSLGCSGVEVIGASRVIVSGNRIFNIRTATDTIRGIYFGKKVTQSIITGNRIHDLWYTGNANKSGTGIVLKTETAGSADSLINNMIWNIGGTGSIPFTTGAIAGLKILGTASGFTILYNSISLTGTYTGLGGTRLSSAAYFASGISGIELRNNILTSSLINVTGTGNQTYAIYSDAPATAFSLIDYNNYAAGGSQASLGYLGGNLSSLAALKVAFGQNQNSMNWMTLYASHPTGDLYPDPASNCILGGRGIPITGIVSDIDNNYRNNSNPDPGAAEFSHLPGLAITASADPFSFEGDSLLLRVEPAGFTSYVWSGPGGFTSTAQTPVINNLNSSNSGYYYVTVTNAGACSSTDSVLVNVLSKHSVYGQLTYANTLATPLKGTLLILSDTNGNPLDSCMTDSTGHFVLVIGNPGNFKLTPVIQYGWGGGNSVDALLALRHFVGLQPLFGLNLAAGDTDNGVTVNSIDAMKIMQRFVGLIQQFPAADWTHDSTPFSLGNYPLNRPIRCLCTGDVNGSHNP